MSVYHYLVAPKGKAVLEMWEFGWLAVNRWRGDHPGALSEIPVTYRGFSFGIPTTEFTREVIDQLTAEKGIEGEVVESLTRFLDEFPEEIYHFTNDLSDSSLIWCSNFGGPLREGWREIDYRGYDVGTPEKCHSQGIKQVRPDMYSKKILQETFLQFARMYGGESEERLSMEERRVVIIALLEAVTALLVPSKTRSLISDVENLVFTLQRGARFGRHAVLLPGKQMPRAEEPISS